MSITETVITPDTPRAALDSRVRTAVLGAIRAEDGHWSIGSPLLDRVMEALGPVLGEAEADRAKLDELGRHITTWFTHHGHNPLPSFGVARALAEGQRQILDRDKSSSGEKAP